WPASSPSTSARSSTGPPGPRCRGWRRTPGGTPTAGPASSRAGRGPEPPGRR
ncbi:MAG: hypothetical protein AVDCRST_MAG48-2349, partial [uncultured Friedmanniella sp.]